MRGKEERAKERKREDRRELRQFSTKYNSFFVKFSRGTFDVKSVL